jgi:hypothetical protein
MGRDPRMIGPLALSLAGHAAVLLFLYIGTHLAWPAPPIPIEVRTAHRSQPRTGAVERRGDPRTPPTKPPRPHASGSRPAAPRPLPPPETTDLAPFAPEDAQLVVLLRMDKLRQSPHREAVEALLGALPDWSTLVAGSGVSPLDDFDALLIATADPRDATATFLAARHADLPKIRALAGRPLPDGDPRQFRTLKPGLTALAPPDAWAAPALAGGGGGGGGGTTGDGKTVSLQHKWLEQLEKFDEVARAPGGPAVLVTFADVPALLQLGAGIPTPQALELATTAEGPLSLRLRAAFQNEAEARAFAAEWPQILARYRSMAALLGLSTALDELRLEVHGSEAQLSGRIPEAQVRLALRWLMPLLPHRPPPQ